MDQKEREQLGLTLEYVRAAMKVLPPYFIMHDLLRVIEKLIVSEFEENA